ncbi:hypothetical protein GCM10010376_26270 [Streptomyces violaceusniger]
MRAPPRTGRERGLPAGAAAAPDDLPARLRWERQTGHCEATAAAAPGGGRPFRASPPGATPSSGSAGFQSRPRRRSPTGEDLCAAGPLDRR